jgi:probable F420-dependent oxidoreductase
MISGSSIPCGIAIPQVFVDEPVDMALVRDFVQRAEALGYDSIWVQEQIMGQALVLEPVALLSYVAGVTADIRMGTAVVITTTRNPILLAKQIATVDAMSGGRLIPGIALGGRPGDYKSLGGPRSHRVRHFLEGLRLLRALWSEEKVDFDGHFWRLENAWISPRPVQQPLPVWFGGRHPDALRRAVDHGDGWMGAGSTTTAQFTEHVKIIQRRMDETGRDPTTFPISKRVYVAVDDDRARAERRLAEWFGVRYAPRPQLGAQVSVWGSADQCVDGLQKVVDAGAEMLMLNQVFDHMEHIEVLAEEVVPHLEPRAG